MKRDDSKITTETWKDKILDYEIETNAVALRNVLLFQNLLEKIRFSITRLKLFALETDQIDAMDLKR